MKLAIPALLLSIHLGATAAGAENAPAQLRGKSVIASWTEERLQRVGGIGDFKRDAFSQQLNAYISTEGRVFARRAVWSSDRRTPGDVSSVGKAGPGPQHAHMSGRTLTITNVFRSGGVRLIRVEFSPDRSTCSTNVILGRENGTGIARGRSRTTGETVEIKEARVSNTSCSVRAGNVFGQ